jgi:5-methylcytosine-specific restriction endonuclease McrA
MYLIDAINIRSIIFIVLVFIYVTGDKLSMKDYPALILNADYQPISYFPLSLWNWQTSIKAVFLNRVNIIAEYDSEVRSSSFSMKIPSVIALKKYVPISKKPPFTRFNLFLRDNFSCQYCGATPSKKTMLEVDHIKPVAKGGDNDMLNLITSCFDCNRGKSARELSDDSVVVKQKKQLDNLQERRQQLEMMLEWRKGLDDLKSETNLKVIEYIESKIEPYLIQDLGKKELGKT